jgi:hypothetical protein
MSLKLKILILTLTIVNSLVESKSIETDQKCPEGFVGRNCSIGLAHYYDKMLFFLFLFF